MEKHVRKRTRERTMTQKEWRHKMSILCGFLSEYLHTEVNYRIAGNDFKIEFYWDNKTSGNWDPDELVMSDADHTAHQILMCINSGIAERSLLLIP